MIVRVHFDNGLVMLFGNSYKCWTQQFDEYCWDKRSDLPGIKSVMKSRSKWVKWGGLKWCIEQKFQSQLNREGVQSNELDNPNPRKYEDMVFYEDDRVTQLAKRIHSACLKNKTDIEAVYRMR